MTIKLLKWRHRKSTCLLEPPGFSHEEAQYSGIEESVAAVWDEFGYVATSLEANAVGIAANWEKIQELEGWKPSVESSIGNLSKYDSSLQASIGNANTSIGTLNTKATNIQTSLGTTNSNVSKVQTSLGNTNTSLNNVTTRVTNLEKKHNPFALGNATSTVTGAIGYIS